MSKKPIHPVPQKAREKYKFDQVLFEMYHVGRQRRWRCITKC